ncbi:MAG: hypothetical protein KJZ86_08780 [Caldilineaceae bacterium]|nr:hypothetical protein [Caldilineaceae bacterium]
MGFAVEAAEIIEEVLAQAAAHAQDVHGVAVTTGKSRRHGWLIFDSLNKKETA